MKKILIAASLSLFATAAMAQTSPMNGKNETTSVNGVESNTTAGQGTGAGADVSKQRLIQGTDTTATGSTTPDSDAATANPPTTDNEGSAVNGVESSTTGGQGTGTGTGMPQ